MQLENLYFPIDPLSETCSITGSMDEHLTCSDATDGSINTSFDKDIPAAFQGLVTEPMKKILFDGHTSRRENQRHLDHCIESSVSGNLPLSTPSLLRPLCIFDEDATIATAAAVACTGPGIIAKFNSDTGSMRVDEEQNSVFMVPVSGASDPLYIEAGYQSLGGQGGTAVSINLHVTIWNRTDALVGHCRLLCDASPQVRLLVSCVYLSVVIFCLYSCSTVEMTLLVLDLTLQSVVEQSDLYRLCLPRLAGAQLCHSQ